MSYKAFISYSHAADGKLAPALQSALQLFAKPWYKLRALHVFRDQTNLSANPALWPSIERALDESEFFLLLASPDAAQSKWVRKEIEHWLHEESTNGTQAKKLLIVVTDGDLVWDNDTKDFNWERTTALPETMRGKIKQEPLYVDLRWARDEPQFSLTHTRFRDKVADLAAPLHGVAKDQIAGEDVRQHRRTKQWAWSAVSVLIVLLIAVSIVAIYAFQQRNAVTHQLVQNHWVNALSARDKGLEPVVAAQHFARIAKITKDNREASNARLAMNWLVGAYRLGGVIQHQQGIRGTSISSDEQAILTWSNDGTARVWNIESGAPMSLPMQHESVVYGAMFDRKEDRVLTWSADGTARVWSTQTGEPLTPYLEHDGLVHGARFSPNEQVILTWSEDGTARLWDATTGKPVGSLLLHEEPVQGAVYSADGASILTWSGNKLQEVVGVLNRLLGSMPEKTGGVARLWNSSTGEALSDPMMHGGMVRGAVFSSNEELILTWSSDNMVRVWERESGKTMGWLLEHPNITGAAFIQGGRRIVTWGATGQAGIWSGESGHLLAELQHGAAITGVSVDRDEQRILTWSEDSTARLWDSKTGRQLIKPLIHEHPVRGATFSRDEKRILTWSGFGLQISVPTDIQATPRGTVRIWDSVSGQPITPPLFHSSPVVGAEFSEDGERVLTWTGYMIAGSKNYARLWDATSGTPLTPPLYHDGPVEGASLTRDEARIVSWSQDGTARVWDRKNRRIAMPSDAPHAGLVRGAVFSPDNRCFLTWSTDRTVRIWGSNDGLPVTPSLVHDNPVLGAVFSRDGSRVLTWTGGRNFGAARIWDSATGKAVTPLMAHGGSVRGASFSRDEMRVLTWSSDGTSRVWDSSTGQPVSSALKNQGAVTGAAFNSDETHILAWGGQPFKTNGTAELWDIKNGRHVISLMEHQGLVRGARFSDDERRIITWSNDGTVCIWSSATGEPITPPLEIDPAMKTDESAALNRLVMGARFNPDQSRVLAWGGDLGGGGGGFVRVWDATTGVPLISPLIHERIVDGAMFLHDSRKVLSWAHKTVRLSDTASGDQITFQHEETVNGVVVSQDGSRILTWSGNFMPGTSPRGVARLWDAQTGKLLTPSLRHETPIMGASFGWEGRRVLTWGARGARLWDATDGFPLTPLLRQAFPILGATLDESEERILTWGGLQLGTVGGARVWHLPSSDETPGSAYVPQIELDTGTRLDLMGELEVLDRMQWQEVKKRLTSLREE